MRFEEVLPSPEDGFAGRGQKNLRERLERQGYFDATVDYSTATRDVKEKEADGKERKR